MGISPVGIEEIKRHVRGYESVPGTLFAASDKEETDLRACKDDTVRYGKRQGLETEYGLVLDMGEHAANEFELLSCLTEVRIIDYQAGGKVLVVTAYPDFAPYALPHSRTTLPSHRRVSEWL